MNRRLKQLAAGSVMILVVSSLAVVTSGSAAAASANASYAAAQDDRACASRPRSTLPATVAQPYRRNDERGLAAPLTQVVQRALRAPRTGPSWRR